MSLLYPVTQPFKLFTGLDGLPLDDGYIYYGHANQDAETVPAQMYWDSVGAIPATQPLRTVSGYIVNNGAPANIYALGDVSVTIRDADGTLVFSNPTSPDLALALSVAGVGTAASIPIVDAGSYYTTDNVEAALQQIKVDLAAVAASFVLPTGTTLDYCGAYGIAAAPTGFVFSSGRTIGNAASNATERNNADTSALYTLLWNNYANTELAIQDSTGTPTTRGVSASADFAANKRLPVPDSRGRVRAGKDDMGGVTASRLTNAGAGIVGTTQGASGGTQTHILTATQLTDHTHTATQGTHTHTDTGHTHTQGTHTHTDIGHIHTQTAHTHTDTGHTHTDSGHAHPITDPGHTHPYTDGNSFSAAAGTNAVQSFTRGTAQTTASAFAGINATTNATAVISSNTALGLQTLAPNISANSPLGLSTESAGAITSGNAAISTVSAGAITVSAASTSAAHQNTQPTIIFTVIIKL